jgi:hypothetical protein
MVPRHVVAQVVGVEDRIGHQPDHVLVLGSVEDVGATPAALDEPGQPELREVLRDRGLRLADPAREFRDGQLPTVSERPQQLHPGEVRQHPEHLHDDVDLVSGRRREIDWVHGPICAHAHMFTHEPDLAKTIDGQVCRI